MLLSFCEPVWASSVIRWCIRERAVDQPLMPGGGVQTASLCDRVKARHGWDIDSVEVDQASVRADYVCPKCRFLYLSKKGWATSEDGEIRYSVGGELPCSSVASRLRDLAKLRFWKFSFITITGDGIEVTVEDQGGHPFVVLKIAYGGAHEGIRAVCLAALQELQKEAR